MKIDVHIARDRVELDDETYIGFLDFVRTQLETRYPSACVQVDDEASLSSVCTDNEAELESLQDFVKNIYNSFFQRKA